MSTFRRKIWNIGEFAVLTAMSPFLKPVVGDTPWFDKGGSTLFDEHIAKATTLLEYGCGGSTVFAAKSELNVVSVETDARYAGTVNEKLQALGLTSKAHVFHSGIGPTLKWGYPLSDSPTPANIRRWTDYTERPWREAKARGLCTDVVLVDGRFRVACVVRSLIEMDALGIEVPILVDDYAGRNDYAAVLDVCSLHHLSGRMAELHRKSGITLERLRRAFSVSIVNLL